MMIWVARTPGIVLLIALLSTAAHGQAWHEGFEGQNPSWRDARDGNKHAPYAAADGTRNVPVTVQHQRLQGTAHSGNGCEWLQVEGNPGSRIDFAHDIGHPRIIEELTPSVWIMADRSSPSLAVRVVLPRTIDPRSGRPMQTILEGPAYTNVGRWQELRLTGIPVMLTRQVHVLRMQFGPTVDDREAYVDAVLLRIYGGPGVTNIWIDDLDVGGHVGSSSPVTAASWNAATEPVSTAAPLVPVRLPAVEGRPPIANAVVPLPPVDQSAPRRRVRLINAVLTVNDVPMFPRVVQHRGEPLPALKRLGFNAVWLQRVPAPELLEEADRLGLKLICPPPRQLTPVAEIGAAFDSVLAWSLGADLSETDLEPTRRWADEVHAADRRVNRPLICGPRVDLRSYSQATDILLIDRRPLGTSLEMSSFETWARRQPLLARAGKPVWTTVQTQPNEVLRQQLVAVDPSSAPPLSLSPDQIRLLVYLAVTSGSRGLVFLSDSPLDAPDAETQQRAMTLELLNLELARMEPWAAQGSLIGSIEPGKRTPDVSGPVLRVDHSRLALPIWSAAGSQYVVPQSAANSLALVLPAVPEADMAYEVTPGGLQSLRPTRVAGGMSISLDEFGLTTQVLLTHDTSIVNDVRRRATASGRREAELHHRIAVQELNSVQTLAGQLALRLPVPAAPQWLQSARQNLQACENHLKSGENLAAAQDAQRAMRSLRLIERAYWDAAVKLLVSPVASPGAVGFDTLPWHLRLVDRLERAGRRFGANRIAGGDFEDLDTMMRAGWRYIQNAPPPSLQSAVDLAPDAARSGRLGLRLAVAAVNLKNPPAVVETPPVLFSSPPVQVEAGQIVCIHGWVQIPEPITASVDGLLIVDSISGEALADRIGQTDGWRRFALYRVAPQSGPMCVTFALSGIGEARLDDVAIQVME